MAATCRCWHELPDLMQDPHCSGPTRVDQHLAVVRVEDARRSRMLGAVPAPA